MARIHELITQLRASNPALGDEIAREVDVLSQRRSFGLNFERHTPEAVELPGRRVRIGDKVRVLPPRGSRSGPADERLWQVVSLNGLADERVAVLDAPMSGGEIESMSVDVRDVVVVAEFRDPIYTGLVSTGTVERGGDKPFHSVINAENYHALQALLYTHRGAVDCIYIDPPYNTGARDWKYNNDYVESDDMYRHSKWLAFMERRLLLAKELLNPDDSVLIVTIDEKEYLRLGMLLEQLFPEARIQMVTSVINPKGTGRANEFSRVEEFIFFVAIGGIRMHRSRDDMISNRDYEGDTEVRWRGLARTGRKGLRGNNPGSWYPIYVRESDGELDSIGDTLLVGEQYDNDLTPEGTVAIWPPSSGSDEYSWSVVPETLRSIRARGGLKVGARRSTSFYYLTNNQFAAIDSGALDVMDREPSGALVLRHVAANRRVDPRSVWNRVSHDAGTHGTGVASAALAGRRFPFPKSLYAVEDALRFFVANKPDAVILDFFSGSGTTAHAVMRLNKQDGGQRRSISITNNEVSADEQKSLRQRGLRPGDPEWDRHGICDYITKPRIEAAITGRTPNGDPIKGDYKFTDEFPMADGFEENVEFFTLTYETPMRVQVHREFARIAPLLWLRAGSRGRRIESLPGGWDVAETYGVIDDIDKTDAFVEAMAANPDVQLAFVVTDEDRFFEAIAHALPEHVEAVRLYDSYLRNFEIDAMRGAR